MKPLNKPKEDQLTSKSAPPNENSEKQEKTARKLSKRLKVGPKLSTSRPQIPTLSTDGDGDLQAEKSQSKDSNALADVIKTDQKGEINSEAKVDNSKSCSNTTIEKPSKLQKRKKVMPNLRIPAQKKKVEPVIKEENSKQTNQQIGVGDDDISKNNYPETSGSKEGLSPTVKEDDCDSSLLNIETPGSSSKKERRVHFESSTISSKTTHIGSTDNDLMILSDVCSEVKKSGEKLDTDDVSSSGI